MKKIHLNINFTQKVLKVGLSAMMLFLCAAPSMAQTGDDEEIVEVVEEANNVRKVEKPKKEYEMVEIQGRVLDAATHEPLAGAQVKSFDNPFYTAMTDEDGVFFIKVPTFVTSLQAALEGYNITQEALNGRVNRVDIKLYSNKYIPGYESKISANRSVGTQGFDHATEMTVDQVVANRLGGNARSISRSALNGQGNAMFMNGLNSLFLNAQPLIVLDGVVFDMLYDSEMLHSGYFNNPLLSINMDDVASIKVLENGSAIYGSKAANGVIVIETKRNTSMATRIDFNASVGVEMIPKTIDVMEAEDYRGYASELLKGVNTSLTKFQFLMDKEPFHSKYGNNTDWKDLAYREALTHNYSLHIQGGDDVANYNLSVGYMNAQSTLKRNDMSRFNIRFNTDIVLNKWFTTRFDASYTDITRNLRDAGWVDGGQMGALAATNVLSLIKAPFLSPYDFDNIGNPTNHVSDADDYLSEVFGKDKVSIANPKAVLDNGEAINRNHVDYTTINVAITPKWQPTRDFSLQERFSYTYQGFDEKYFTPLDGMPAFKIPGSEEVTNSDFSLFTHHHAIFSDTRADWVLPLDEHRVEIYGGVRFMNDTYKSDGIGGYSNSNDKTPNISSSLSSKYLKGIDMSWRSLSYYANVDYNYMEKYYLQGQLAVETSSRFGKDTDAGMKLFGVPWGFFPSIQGAWVITNEKWFKPNNAINFLKLNVGFESLGNDGVDNNSTLTYMSSQKMLINKNALALTNIGNSKLRWETTNRLNAGFEGNFASNRLNVRFNYFKSWTSNLISLGTLAYVTGLTDYWTNDGKLENEGFNVAVTARAINNRNFKMEAGVSMGHYQNKITQLPSNLAKGQSYYTTDIFNGTILTKVGSPVGLFYGYKVNKDNPVFSTSDEAAAANLRIEDAAGNSSYFSAGDVQFVDKDQNGLINDDDRFVIGDPNPDVYGNIFANMFIGKHWTVSLNFNYSIGNDIYNYQRAMLESGSMFINQSTALNRRWMAEGQVTDIPQITYGDPMGNSRFSDRWIEDGSYLKLKNVTIGYQIPISNEYIQGISVWAAANNLFTLTRYLGSDPEVYCGNGVLMQGIDAGFLTPGRSFMLGVKINL